MLDKIEKIVVQGLPKNWQRLGKIMPRGNKNDYDSDVTGDPCIVWDKQRGCYHMFYFAQHKENGIEYNSDGHAIVDNPFEKNLHSWTKLGQVQFMENGITQHINTHKPWILMDPYVPNTAVKWKGYYWLFTATINEAGVKFIQAAYATDLDGPWTIDRNLDIMPGPTEAPDGYHAEAPSAYFFQKERKILVFYMGYPIKKQENKFTPYGSSSMLAIIDAETGKIDKHGVILAPSSDRGNWTSGYIGGFQIFCARKGWYAILNASPTPPCSIDENGEMREPSPSLGGFAYTEEDFPVKGWRAEQQPIEYVNDIPQDAQRDGECVNLWRHHMVLLPTGKAVILYNSGNYGNEQMFGKIANIEITIQKKEEIQ